MGHGDYSSSRRSVRATNLGYFTKPKEQIFQQQSINNAMNPKGIGIRESRDSEEHPNSLAIIIALDVTGSMGSVPHYLVKEGLPHIVEQIINAGILDPQILFLGIGDHVVDSAPLQVGQFESSDELLDKWLTDVYLEGGGGGNEGESYMLAWYFAAKHTSIDCFEKRNKKGFLFTIGDEPVLESISQHHLNEIMGKGQYEKFMSNDLYHKASEKYHAYHLHIKETMSGSRQHVMDDWKQMLSDNFIAVNRRNEVADIIAKIVSDSVNSDHHTTQDQSATAPEQTQDPTMML